MMNTRGRIRKDQGPFDYSSIENNDHREPRDDQSHASSANEDRASDITHIKAHQQLDNNFEEPKASIKSQRPAANRRSQKRNTSRGSRGKNEKPVEGQEFTDVVSGFAEFIDELNKLRRKRGKRVKKAEPADKPSKELTDMPPTRKKVKYDNESQSPSLHQEESESMQPDQLRFEKSGLYRFKDDVTNGREFLDILRKEDREALGQSAMQQLQGGDLRGGNEQDYELQQRNRSNLEEMLATQPELLQRLMIGNQMSQSRGDNSLNNMSQRDLYNLQQLLQAMGGNSAALLGQLSKGGGDSSREMMMLLNALSSTNQTRMPINIEEPQQPVLNDNVPFKTPFRKAATHVALAYFIYIRSLEGDNASSKVDKTKMDPTYNARRLKQQKDYVRADFEPDQQQFMGFDPRMIARQLEQQQQLQQTQTPFQQAQQQPQFSQGSTQLAPDIKESKARQQAEKTQKPSHSAVDESVGVPRTHHQQKANEEKSGAKEGDRMEQEHPSGEQSATHDDKQQEQRESPNHVSVDQKLEAEADKDEKIEEEAAPPINVDTSAAYAPQALIQKNSEGGGKGLHEEDNVQDEATNEDQKRDKSPVKSEAANVSDEDIAMHTEKGITEESQNDDAHQASPQKMEEEVKSEIQQVETKSEKGTEQDLNEHSQAKNKAEEELAQVQIDTTEPRNQIEKIEEEKQEVDPASGEGAEPQRLIEEKSVPQATSFSEAKPLSVNQTENDYKTDPQESLISKSHDDEDPKGQDSVHEQAGETHNVSESQHESSEQPSAITSILPLKPDESAIHDCQKPEEQEGAIPSPTLQDKTDANDHATQIPTMEEEGKIDGDKEETKTCQPAKEEQAQILKEDASNDPDSSQASSISAVKQSNRPSSPAEDESKHWRRKKKPRNYNYASTDQSQPSVSLRSNRQASQYHVEDENSLLKIKITRDEGPKEELKAATSQANSDKEQAPDHTAQPRESDQSQGLESQEYRIRKKFGKK